jgi:hypothetical protein
MRHTGLTLAAPGATTKEIMRRGGQSSPNAAMRYQHATDDGDRAIAQRLAALAGKTPFTDSNGYAEGTDIGPRPHHWADTTLAAAIPENVVEGTFGTRARDNKAIIPGQLITIPDRPDALNAGNEARARPPESADDEQPQRYVSSGHRRHPSWGCVKT